MDRGSWHCIGGRDQNHPKGGKNARRQNGCLRKPYKKLRKEEKWKAKEKGKDISIWIQSQRIARRDNKAFLSEQCKEIEENNRMRKTSDPFKEIRDTKGTFHAKMGSIKDRNTNDLTEAEDIKKRWQENTEELYKKVSMSWITMMVWSLT